MKIPGAVPRSFLTIRHLLASGLLPITVRHRLIRHPFRQMALHLLPGRCIFHQGNIGPFRQDLPGAIINGWPKATGHQTTSGRRQPHQRHARIACGSSPTCCMLTHCQPRPKAKRDQPTTVGILRAARRATRRQPPQWRNVRAPMLRAGRIDQPSKNQTPLLGNRRQGATPRGLQVTNLPCANASMRKFVVFSNGTNLSPWHITAKCSPRPPTLSAGTVSTRRDSDSENSNEMASRPLSCGAFSGPGPCHSHQQRPFQPTPYQDHHPNSHARH